MVDLFGAPIYDSPRAVQPALFPDRHWFELGYIDGAGDWPAAKGANAAYLHGYRAARRHVQERALAVGLTDSLERAWRENVAACNVSE